MTPTRLTICAIALALLPALPAGAAPAYVASTVNLRAAAGTANEIVAKIPGGSLVDASNCTDWCEVEWQGKKGFAIATALDRSGRVPSRGVRQPAAGAPTVYEDDGYVPAAPPVVYGAPYYYGYGYRPYYRGYGPRYGYGYRGYRRW
ncbi:MAG: hypothetical protein WCG92_21790 [Hyphomicrobiales bacterium]|nr:hypothetical protein [Alphaproteobacteria bacterium]